MQGRFSPLVDGRIQAFPWSHWREEFSLAHQHDFQLMEWTLDQERLTENPLLEPSGQTEIYDLCRQYNLRIPSLTGDCFMQAPFWKASGKESETLKQDFCSVANACAAVGIQMMILPLVDNGRLETEGQEDSLVNYLSSQSDFLKKKGLKVLFESDFSPDNLARFISRLDLECFGINYDIGNSAALGFSPKEEFKAYGARVRNVHVKDRQRNSTTVPLGTGDADFHSVFEALAQIGYTGNYILQTARADKGDHARMLCQYRDMTEDWLAHYAA